MDDQKISLTPETPRDLFLQIFNKIDSLEKTFARFEKTITDIQKEEIHVLNERVRVLEDHKLKIDTIWKVIAGAALLLSFVSTVMGVIQIFFT